MATGEVAEMQTAGGSNTGEDAPKEVADGCQLPP